MPIDLDLSPVELSSSEELAEMPVVDRNAHLLAAAAGGAFDFLDFGTHKGAGLQLGLRFGGRSGLGVEINERKATDGLRRGFYVYTGDILTFPQQERAAFRFAICRHVLEHLPNRYIVGTIVWKLAQMCTDFLYIEQPNFDDELYLRRHGLTWAHSTLRYHTCRMATRELTDVLRDLGVVRYVIGGLGPMRDSSNHWIHCADAPPNRWTYREGEDLPKPSVEFERTLWRDFAVFADISSTEAIDLDALVAAVKGLTLWERSGLHLGQ